MTERRRILAEYVSMLRANRCIIDETPPSPTYTEPYSVGLSLRYTGELNWERPHDSVRKMETFRSAIDHPWTPLSELDDRPCTPNDYGRKVSYLRNFRKWDRL